jgi:hypothetical protein
METPKTEFELTVDKSAEALWEDFERTGSVKTYLLFLQKDKDNQEIKPPHLPSLS